MTEQIDYPFEIVAKKAAELVRAGATVYFKFSCARCGSRQTFGEPNTLYKTGKCEECGHVTSLVLQGCNYLIVFKQ